MSDMQIDKPLCQHNDMKVPEANQPVYFYFY